MKTTININGIKMVIAMMTICSSVFMSCSSEDDIVISQDEKNSVLCEAAPIITEQIGSRSSLSYTGSTMQFSWDKDDRMTVFAKGDDNAIMIYKIQQGVQDYTNNARFYPESFNLKDNTTYYALSKTEGTDGSHGGGEGTMIPDQRNITLDYSGQVQQGNASYDHIGKYDFMAAAAVRETSPSTLFQFKHLGATLRIVIMEKNRDEVFRNCKFTKLEIYDSENSYRQPLRHFSFEKGLAADGTYAPIWPDQTIDSDKRFSVELRDKEGNPGISPSDAFNDNTGENTYHDLVVYAEVPPVDFTGKKVSFILEGVKGDGTTPIKYYATDYYAGGPKAIGNVEMGKAYIIYSYAEETVDYNVTLKVNRMWQHGNTIDQSRATGDPGYDDKFELPSHVYLFFCAGGKIKQINNYDYTAETKNAQWTPNADNTIFSFKTSTKFEKTKLTTDAEKKSVRVYAIAADEAIAHGLAENGSEDAVKNLVYTYNGQDRMRDLYSTPWVSDATFIGNLNEPIKDIILYHVAAKVDLKWNSPTALSGNVSVNNFQKDKISIFQPTKNGTGDFTGTTKATESTALTVGTQWNGRQVYYLPQPSNGTYNVTVGANTQNVTFTPNTDGGYTSWLRWLKQY